MSRPTYVQIDLHALKHNLARVRAIAPHCSVIAMVKANAYGHGLVRISQALSDADALGVASLEEGMTLREAGIKNSIVLMEGLFHEEELSDAIQQHFSIVVHHTPHIEMLEKHASSASLSVWLKINTGMHRLGIEPKMLDSIHARLSALPIIKKPIGLMTHFAEADRVDHPTTQQQITAFHDFTAHLSGPRSLANSAGVMAWPAARADWVRPGLMLYGASPFADKTGEELGLKPVMTLSSRLIAIVPVKAGGKVGYGGTWTAPEDLCIGVVGVGYGDGYPQFAENNTPVLLNGKICSLVGRVSMDMLTIDLRTQPEAKVGDPVTLWGKGLPVEQVARHSRTLDYEILTRMTPRPKIEVL